MLKGVKNVELRVDLPQGLLIINFKFLTLNS